MSVEQVATQSGYERRRSFAWAFKETYACKSSAYREIVKD
jgi:transcriptional regulator GlxA family with amidase domain